MNSQPMTMSMTTAVATTAATQTASTITFAANTASRSGSADRVALLVP